jgi:response regulator RpfG family c-di-GMP phosphodiesterase
MYEDGNEDTPQILIVDDEKVIRDILSDFLSMEGFLVRSVEDGLQAMKELQRRSYNLMITDLKMPNMGGLELLEEVRRRDMSVITVIMTGFGTVETAIAAMKKGAYDYILKPFKVEEVIHIVERGLARQRLEQENTQLKEMVGLYKISEAVGSSLDLDDILDMIMEVTLKESGADVAVLSLDPEGGDNFTEHLRADLNPQAAREDIGELSYADILEQYERQIPVLANGNKIRNYFERMPDSGGLVSFTAIPLRVRDRIIGSLNAYSFTRGKRFSEGSRKLLSVLGARAAISIDNARLLRNLRRANEGLLDVNRELQENFLQTIQGFVSALEENDRYTRGHSERVAVYTRLIASGLGQSEEEVELAVQAGLLHDIGKIGIHYEQLNKPGKLTKEEIEMFRQHPVKGKRILEPIPFMRNLIPGTYCHHEHYDGSGYPQGLKGAEIPLLGRMIAVADTYDAMTSDRAYRRALPHQAAIDELVACSGTQFDKELVEVFLKKIDIYRDDRRAEGKDVPK